MKILALLLCVLLLSCEKRVADPELEEVREWFLSEEGRTAVGAIPLPSGDSAFDRLISCEDWVVKPLKDFVVFRNKQTTLGGIPGFVLFGSERKSDDGWAVGVYRDGKKLSVLPAIFRLSRGEFESLGDPVSYMELFRE